MNVFEQNGHKMVTQLEAQDWRIEPLKSLPFLAFACLMEKVWSIGREEKEREEKKKTFIMCKYWILSK